MQTRPYSKGVLLNKLARRLHILNAKDMSALLITAVATVLVINILFIPPYPGLIDQGDFGRILIPANLDYVQDDRAEGSGIYGTKVIENYSVGEGWAIRALLPPQSTMLFPVMAVRTLCKIFQIDFSMLYLAALLSGILLGLIFFVVRTLYEHLGKFTYIIGGAVLFVLFSGSYLIWFNSLYQEGCVYLGYLLFLGCSLIAVLKEKELGLKHLIPVFVSAGFLLGQKPQLISALPVVLLVIGFLIRRNLPELSQETESGRETKMSQGSKPDRKLRTLLNFRHRKKNAQSPVPSALKRKKYYRISAISVFLIVGLCLYCYAFNRHFCANDTTYQSIFYGILNPGLTNDPQGDLIELGLDPALAQDAGKTAYEPSDSYFCPPKSEKAQDMIFNKVGTVKVVLFYLKHPNKLISMLDYSASQSQTTKSGFMLYAGETKGAGVPDRLNFWDSLRSKFPFNKTFLGYAIQYLVFCGVSVWIYLRRTAKGSLARWLIGLYWANIGIGILQFPLPFLGNGMADTAKQLFLFVLSYDIMLLSTTLAILYGGYRWVFRRHKRKSAGLSLETDEPVEQARVQI